MSRAPGNKREGAAREIGFLTLSLAVGLLAFKNGRFAGGIKHSHCYQHSVLKRQEGDITQTLNVVW